MRIRGSIFVAALVASASLPAGAEPEATDPRLHPGEVRILRIDDTDLREIIPGVLYMKHWFGTDLSVAYFRFLPGQGDSEQARPAMHTHGEEFAIQLRGRSQVIEADGTVHEIEEGDAFIIKPWIRHTGSFGTRENKILSIVTPPRKEYPAEGGKAYFPGQEDGSK